MSSRNGIDEPQETSAGEPGDDLPCSGCGELVKSSEPLYTAAVRGLPYGFHADCYEKWGRGREIRPG